MNNEKNTVDAAVELQEIARAIDGYAGRRGFSLKKLMQEFPALGSEKTFRDMREGNFDGYDLEKQLANYKGVFAIIQEMTGNDSGELLYDDLPAVVAVRLAVLEVMKSWGTDRVVFVDGESGMGKSTAAKVLCGKYGQRIVMIEATDMWNDSPSAMLGEILLAMGWESVTGLSGMQRLEKCRELLNAARRCLIIDEAHHMGPHCMNVVKSLTNRTPGEFVMIGIPAMWAKLHKAAYVEARQLSTNRISERVKLEFTERDVRSYLANIFPDADKQELLMASRIIKPAAIQNGCMAFVRDVARRIRTRGLEVQPVTEAVQAVLKRR